MKKLIKKLQVKIKNNLLVRLTKVKKENKYLKERLTQEVLSKRELYDELTKKQEEIRRLSLGVRDEKILRDK